VRGVSPLLLLAPFWVLFELWQLVVSERYLGIKQIEQGTDPRSLDLGELRAAFWCIAMLAEGGWMLALLFERYGRVQTLCMLVVTALGYTLRRNCGLKWVLVILTFEGAIRIGMLFSICGMFWHRL
jgi:hypothetical protein